MGLGGRWFLRVVLLLGTLLVASNARAEDAGPRLVFDASAEGLPQTEIRSAVEHELGRPLASEADTASGELSVAVDAEHRLVVRYRTAGGSAERVLPMPTEPADVPLIISLAAGNLARDQSAAAPRPKAVEAVPTTLAEQKPAQKPPEPRDNAAKPAPPPPVRFKRHRLGIHVAKDIAFVGASNACGQAHDNYACFYEGTTDEPFWHTPYPYEDTIETGPVLATTRLLVSYDYAPTPAFSIGGRLDYALRGGPPAGQEPTIVPPQNNLNLLPPHTKGTGGAAFLPVHIELRAAFWFLPLGAKPVSAYAGAGIGAAQVDSKTTIAERDCAHVLNSPAWNGAADGSYDDCVQGRSTFAWQKLPETKVDAWKKMGKGFVTLTAGVLLPLGDSGGGLVLNVNAMVMFPSSGIVLEPSLGYVAAF